jgi:hypothetical protein
MASFNKNTLPSPYSVRLTESTDVKTLGSGNDQAEIYCASDDSRRSLSLLYLQEYEEDTATKVDEAIHIFREPTLKTVFSVTGNTNTIQESSGEVTALPVVVIDRHRHDTIFQQLQSLLGWKIIPDWTLTLLSPATAEQWAQKHPYFSKMYHKHVPEMCGVFNIDPQSPAENHSQLYVRSNPESDRHKMLVFDRTETPRLVGYLVTAVSPVKTVCWIVA